MRLSAVTLGEYEMRYSLVISLVERFMFCALDGVLANKERGQDTDRTKRLQKKNVSVAVRR